MAIYLESFPVNFRDYVHIGDAFCIPCGEIRFTHIPEGVGTECGSFCVFCGSECNECGEPIF